MSCSKPLPPFTYDLMCFWNRDQLASFSSVCRSLKNFTDRYFHSKPCRIFDRLRICGGWYALVHNNVHWHPNRDDYSVQQFLAGQECSNDESKGPHNDRPYYSFADMRPYLGPTIRIKKVYMFMARDSMYNPEHIAEMESIAYLWRDGDISIRSPRDDGSRIVAEDFQPILNSPTILKCRELVMTNANFSFKDYKVLYTVKVFGIFSGEEEIDSNYWPNFLEQPGVKPIIVLHRLRRENVDKALDRIKEAFSSAVLPISFKVVFVQDDEPLTEFRETNKTSREKLELKKGLPVEYLKSLPEYKKEYLQEHDNYTLERSII